MKPFVSDKDIHSGARWQTEITGQLDSCSFGVLIVTAENQTSPWLQFEAGALSKSVSDSRVVPLLINLRKSDLLLPLNMFQAETFDKGGIAALLSSMNENTEEPLGGVVVESLVEKWWPELEQSVAQIPAPADKTTAEPQRSARDLLEELVTMVRSLRNASAEQVAARSMRRSSVVRGVVDELVATLEAAGITVEGTQLLQPTEVIVTPSDQAIPDDLVTSLGQLAEDRGLRLRIERPARPER